MNLLSKIAMALIPCLMAACGGGGSNPDTEPQNTSADPVDKYVGQWVRNCEVMFSPAVNASYPDGLSELEDLTIGKINASEYGTTSIETKYPGTTCTGEAISQATTLGAAQILGTKTVAFGVVDKVTIVRNGVALKLISQVADEGLA
ncbi:hypothetical protein [Hydrogenophaga laconesensis]|uniref:Lipoprotein n=1 Tax=Hydrogenophaga laconesensis TaxID=1805971 RepID=A0ABU1VI98_9BURK|nr:hypothetical protein [Hydrogenophaga laconesensis]MDR7097214.1 hypothetical protein [Hydrogenophaga laconesensis]